MTPSRIKNIALCAHVDAGKTTLCEQMLYRSGQIRKPGSVDEGTTQTDHDPIERQRGISVFSSCVSVNWKGCAINLVDTPGHADFAGEAERSLACVDAAVLVISAAEGVQAHTEALFSAFRTAGIPCVVFLNKIDRAGSRAAETLRELQSLTGLPAVMLNLPRNEGEKN